MESPIIINESDESEYEDSTHQVMPENQLDQHIKLSRQEGNGEQSKSDDSDDSLIITSETQQKKMTS